MEKKQIDSQYFIKKLRSMREGIITHRNEASTVANFVKIYTDGLIDKMRTPGSSPQLFDEHANVFILDTDSENLFVRQCLNKALAQFFRKHRLTPRQESTFKGFLTDALMRSSYGGEPEIGYLIHVHRPFDWKTPKEMEKKRSLDRLGNRLRVAHQKENH